MEYKVLVGQICLATVCIAAMALGYDHDLLFLVAGSLATSIGYPFVKAEK